MQPTIAREFHFGSLLRFALPSMLMMIFNSLYTIVDGIFVARYVGTDALSATNIVYPAINILLAISIMLATGGSAVVARKLGEGRPQEARSNFSLILLVGVLAGIALCITGQLALDPLCRLLGANDALLGYCKEYLGLLLYFAPALVLQLLFQTLFVTAGHPGLGLGLTVAAGLANVLLDYLFIVPLQMGLPGAALATAIGYCIPAVAGVAYFLLRRKEALHLVSPRWDGRMLLESCFNGSSEMVTNASAGITTYLFNILMLQMLGEDGVAAITIVLYAQFLLTALYLGFSIGVAPVISYNHGSANHPQLRRIFKICIGFIAGSSVGIFLLALLLSGVIVGVFAEPGTQVYAFAREGFPLFALSFLFAGLNIFASAMFTAFSDGKTSALLSFLRTFGFILLGLLFLPSLLKVNGLWLAVPFAELLTLLLSVYCFHRKGGQYNYL